MVKSSDHLDVETDVLTFLGVSKEEFKKLTLSEIARMVFDRGGTIQVNEPIMLTKEDKEEGGLIVAMKRDIEEANVK